MYTLIKLPKLLLVKYLVPCVFQTKFGKFDLISYHQNTLQKHEGLKVTFIFGMNKIASASNIPSMAKDKLV